MSQAELFDLPDIRREGLAVLRGLALGAAAEVLAAVDSVSRDAPFRHMQVPGGGTMSVAMTSCGAAGWVTDAQGYRYAPLDPLSGKPWPDIPDILQDMAVRAAQTAGFDGFLPDSCLINRYEVGAKMGLHQDRNEADSAAPVVSVSLGLPCVFQFGGLKRSDPVERILLRHGDVAVWGGPLRKAYHGVLALKAGSHEIGAKRINLTFRKAS
ncbi:MAG: DNA oxidative demethylase AlkB [Asticcacaulis sp.]